MVLPKGFERNLDLLQRSLSVTSLRHQVHADNIANAETPNFKRSSISFEAELKRALILEESSKGNLDLRRTSDKHWHTKKPPTYSDIKPHKILDFLTTSKNNGNNVDIEVEAQQILSNKMMYDLLALITGNHFRQIDIVLR